MADVALVTGASRGIGAAIAQRLAAGGFVVAITARTEHEGDHRLEGSLATTAARIRSAGSTVLPITADLAKQADRARIVETVERELGPIDVLINNAAVTYFEPVLDFPERHFQVMFDVQVRAPFELAQRVLPGHARAPPRLDSEHLVARGRPSGSGRRSAHAVGRRCMACARRPSNAFPRGLPQRSTSTGSRSTRCRRLGWCRRQAWFSPPDRRRGRGSPGGAGGDGRGRVRAVHRRPRAAHGQGDVREAAPRGTRRPGACRGALAGGPAAVDHQGVAVHVVRVGTGQVRCRRGHVLGRTARAQRHDLRQTLGRQRATPALLISGAVAPRISIEF